MACAPSEDSDQPGHLPSLISLRCLHEESLGLSYPLSAQRRLTGRMPRLIGVFAGRTCHFVGFVMRRLIYCVGQQRRLWQACLSLRWCTLFTCVGSFNLFMHSGLCYPRNLDQSIVHFRGAWCTFFHFYFQ